MAKAKRTNNRKRKSAVKTLLADDGLTPRQKLFADAYLRDGHGTNAAEEAGYKGSRVALGIVASQNLRKPSIRAYINKITGETATENTMARQERIEFLSAMARGEIEVDDVISSDGFPVLFTRRPNAAERLKATDQLAKMHADYLVKLDVNVTHYVAEIPAKIASSADWSKTVEAEVIREKK